MNITPQQILQAMGLDMLNGMQEEMVQASHRYHDIVLLSPTGSGKTLAYLIPLMQRIDETIDEVQAVVIVPSRELAQQTHEVVKAMKTPVRSVAVYGGRAAMDEHRVIKGARPHIIIGTPGRLIDHLTKGNFSPEQVGMMVIDEFDKCLELGFQDEMAEVLKALPRVTHHTLLSATDCPQIPRFVGAEDGVKRLDFTDAQEQIPDRIDVSVVASPVKDKLDILARLLRHLGQEQSLVFVGFRESVERVADYLRHEGFAVSAYHGGMEQKNRERALYRFAGGSANIMVSTDLAARGLDIPALDNVIHYHFPLDEQAYVHRNGRTARWDAQGKAFIIVGPEEHLPEYIQGQLPQWRCPKSLPAPAQPKWTTLYIGKGKKDKLSKGDIAGFLMKVGGLGREEVGRIDVRDHFTYVSIFRSRLKETLARVRGQKIKGIKTIIEPTR